MTRLSELFIDRDNRPDPETERDPVRDWYASFRRRARGEDEPAAKAAPTTQHEGDRE